MKKLSLNDACAIAESRDGKCLSIEYKDNKTPLIWCCSKTHTWSAPLGKIKNDGMWCPYCIGTAKLTIEFAQQIALSKCGQCLSEKYINSKSPLLWQCNKSHTWYASLSNVKNYGKWCPYCTDNRLTLEDAKQIAYNKEGKCLSNQYNNNITPLLWQCNKSHVLNLGELQKTAYLRGGECLSKDYTKSKNQYYWKCDKGHTWYTSFNSIKNHNSWCPFCSKFKRENLCREIVTKYLGSPSENRWPDFLKTSERPQGLQLDIFYPEYGLAIEVQGVQHEKYIKFFHRGDPDNFIKQQARDQLCVKKTGLF